MSSGIEIVADQVVGDAERLKHQFVEAKPFRHVVIDGFLRKDLPSALLSEFPSFDKGNSVGDDNRIGGKSTVERIRTLGPSFRALDDAIQSPAFLTFLSSLTGIDNLLYDPFYLGGGTHDNRPGQSLQAHVDFNYHPSERWHRRLNLIVYLNENWQTSWGGNLEFFRDPYTDSNPFARIAPVLNRCVIFETTEHSWHGFDRIADPAGRTDLSRKSIALYFYSKHRPAEEIAAKHTTHYVNRQLPERFVTGYTLEAADVEVMKELIQSRDAQIRNLYSENASLLQAQERGLSGQIIYLLKRLYVRYRR